ncbi:hypothetical protein AAWM_08711 [Aspergillus awamori]|uniref:Uncharacterized protein n=1 Tax=Aspergillus awamori TaxID=105351 RepID=A0A401L2V7_ASPAW|nr:hypothetical protein AAWM_08711 [Aspergillus awamori]
MLPEGFTEINLDNHDNSEAQGAFWIALKRATTVSFIYLSQITQALCLHRIFGPTKVPWNSWVGILEVVVVKIRFQILSTLGGMRRDLDAGFARRRDYHVPEYVSTTVNRDLKRLLKFPNIQMSKDGFYHNDLKIVQKHLWCNDSFEYRGQYPERTRVDLSALMLLYYFTPARTGEVHESTTRRISTREREDTDLAKHMGAAVMAACYRHFRLSVEWIEGEIMLVLDYDRDYTKGSWRMQLSELPTHGFYEKYTEKTPLLLNIHTFFLPLASADRAFRDYEFVSEIFDEVDLLSSTLQEGEHKTIGTIYLQY